MFRLIHLCIKKRFLSRERNVDGVGEHDENQYKYAPLVGQKLGLKDRVSHQGREQLQGFQLLRS